LHHLTPHNSIDPSPATTGLSAVSIDWSGLDGTNTALEVDHLTCSVAAAPSSNRSSCLKIASTKKTLVHDNDLTCTAQSKACNGLQLISGVAGYVNSEVYNNKGTIVTNTVSGGLPRMFFVSGPDTGSVGAQGIKVYSNYCEANNGRCFRFKQVNDLVAHGNEVLNCAATMQYGCYHFADPDGANAVGDAQADIYNETIALDTGGVAFWLRDGNGWSVKNSTVTGTHGQAGQLLTGGLVTTSATFCGIAGAAGLDVNSTAAASTTVHVYQAGTWTGAGTIDNMGSCPGVGGSPLVLLSPITLNFNAQVVGTTSSAQTITLSNPGDNTLNIASIVASTTSAPTSPGDFAIDSTTCGATLAAAASCAVNVTFTPVAGGNRTGRVRFTTDAASSPDDVSTSGMGQIVLTLRGGTFRGMNKN
jgi:hypothetical protein